jgi:hypothetical protein
MASEYRLALMLNDVAASTTENKFWLGGRGTFIVESLAWGGGSVKLQMKTPNGTWIDIDPMGTLTADGAVGFELPPCEVKVVVDTATGVYAWATGSRVQ